MGQTSTRCLPFLKPAHADLRASLLVPLPKVRPSLEGGLLTWNPPQKVMFGSSRLWCHSPPKRGAYRNVDPTGRIAALEMLGALLLTSLLIHHMEVHIFYAFSLRWSQTTSAASTAEPADAANSYITISGAQITPSHCKRDLTQWADELTHLNPCRFSPKNWPTLRTGTHTSRGSSSSYSFASYFARMAWCRLLSHLSASQGRLVGGCASGVVLNFRFWSSWVDLPGVRISVDTTHGFTDRCEWAT